MIIQEAHSSSLELSISQSCKALDVSRSSYCKWRTEQDANLYENSENAVLRDEIQDIALEFPGYGYRRITAELQNCGYPVNYKRVLRLMHLDSLLCHKKKFKPVTTGSSHGLPVYPNLLKSSTVTGLNQIWVSDITYIQLQQEHIYLAVILDLHSRKCIGWDLGRSLGGQLAMNALAKALSNRCLESLAGIIHHSDLGIQYASNDDVDCLENHNILISMSRKGNPYDNAYAESFIKTLKGRGGISE